MNLRGLDQNSEGSGRRCLKGEVWVKFKMKVEIVRTERVPWSE